MKNLIYCANIEGSLEKDDLLQCIAEQKYYEKGCEVCGATIKTEVLFTAYKNIMDRIIKIKVFCSNQCKAKYLKQKLYNSKEELPF